MKITSLTDLPHTAAYLRRINAEPRSLQKAVVRQEHGSGYWRDICIVKFDKKGVVQTQPEYAPREDEQEKIALEFAPIVWPETVFIDLHDPDMPKMVTEAAEDKVFHFKDEDGNVVMIQVRLDKRDGKKAYVPITKWSDGEFRFLEPEGKLPLFGRENLKDHTTVLIVEGAKVAKYVQWLSDGKTPEARKARDEHPWGSELSNLCVIGWCSGALSADRSDWGAIRKAGITRAYVALDQDQVGREALPKISKQLRCVTHAIQFSDDWPASSDLYDSFPDKFFKKIDGKKYYIGPSFNDLLIPATWLTDVIPNPEDERKKKVVLRPHARGLFQYIEESELFCYVEMPDIIRKADSLDAMMRAFCDCKKVSELFLEAFSGRISAFDYSPAHNERRIIVNGKTVINLYTPSNVKPRSGDPAPWLEFMEQLIPDERERHLVMRYVATLYARPEIRMIYALLLVSSETGTGKSTLGRIIQQLVGPHNCSMPSESVMAGEFNGWAARRRVVIANEIYSGMSWKMFTKLKDMITEPTISLRMMFKDPVDISMWSHFILFSNSMLALKVDSQDRRIFAPRVTETRWGDDKWKRFHEWLDAGGIQIIADWCMNFGDYASPGERAPMTDRKREMIEASRSKASVRAEELTGLLIKEEKPTAIPDKEILIWLEHVTNERVYESLLDIRKVMKKYGAIEAKDFGVDRISFNSQMCNILLNKSAATELEKIVDVAQRKDYVRSIVRKPNELMRYED